MPSTFRSFVQPVLLTVLCLLFYLLQPLAAMDNRAQDTLLQRPDTTSRTIRVIGIDDQTLEALGPWNTWPRSYMAQLIELLNASADSRPAAIGIDVMYFGDTQPEADLRLAQAVSAHDNVVLASQILFSNAIVSDAEGYWHSNMIIEDIQEPFCDAPTGFTNVLLDTDGVCRHSLLSVPWQGQTYNNFAYSVYQKYLQNTHATSSNIPPVDASGTWLIPYQGSPGDYGRGLSFIDVLNGQIDPAFFKDNIVIIGAYASGMQDAYYTPPDKSLPMYGAEINANMVQALLDGNFKQPVSIRYQMLLVALFVFAGCLLLRRLTVWQGLICLLLASLGYLLLVLLFWRAGWVLQVVYIPLFLLLLYGYQLAWHYLIERQKRLEAIQTFKRYMAPQIVESVINHPEALRLGGSKRDIAVMFIDIRGFTPLSEGLPPEDVVAILNEYLTLTSTAIFEYGGTLDKFIGDATMAIFNAPLDQDDYVYQALKAAYAIAQGSKALEEKLMAAFGRSVSYGIGVNCGPAVVGNIGASFRMDYTAIGDTVNTAARLESKAGPGQILISEHVIQALSDRIRVTEIGPLPLKGKQVPLNIYQLDGFTDDPHQ